MKFAHEFKDALIQQGFPPYWVESAIPYGQLKKCIKKVEGELRSIGLDSATLSQLYPDTPDEIELNRELVGFEYDFKSGPSLFSSFLSQSDNDARRKAVTSKAHFVRAA